MCTPDLSFIKLIELIYPGVNEITVALKCQEEPGLNLSADRPMFYPCMRACMHACACVCVGETM